MNFFRQKNFPAAVLFLAAVLVIPPAAAQTNPNFSPGQKVLFQTNLIPPKPQWRSPVESFRQLLAMSPKERGDYLTNKPSQIRARLLDKVKEYLVLNPDERELRLRATELRWYLLPLLHESPTNRAERLELIPDDLRRLVDSRLGQWDALPSEFQKEFLDNERTLRYFTHVDATNSPPALPMPNGGDQHQNLWAEDQARWNALSEVERQKITNQFNQFFELTADEKQKTLNTLSDAERAQMEKTLQAFDKLPGPQRIQCIHAFTEFAGMNPKDRTDFLKNAEHWSQMSPKERQAWRDLVAKVPQWPPLPILPPVPPHIHPHPRLQQLVATNLN
jgi:hypothetical protein